MKKIAALLTVPVMALSFTGCGSKNSSSTSSKISNASTSGAEEEDNNVTSNEATTTIATENDTIEPETIAQHISPIETVTAECGTQVTVNRTIPYTSGSNTIKIPLADLIEEGDIVSSFTFVIYSDNGSNIGEFKGGCGISVNGDCPATTDKGWYQSSDFSAPTQGSYGEIKWDVPSEIQNYITSGGEVLFGYWWGNAPNIRVDSVICTFTRKRDVPVDGTNSKNVGISTGYTEGSNIISVPAADLIPEGCVPEVITYNVSTSGSFRKFNGAFGIGSGDGYYQSPDTAVFTDSSSLSLTWFVNDNAKAYYSKDSEIKLGYWWSEQPNITLDSISVKYSQSDGSYVKPIPIKEDPVKENKNSNFRSASEIVKQINVGWNLGNTLEVYNTDKKGLESETGWGNPKASKELVMAVKNAGFNSIRIPVTWSEHMQGDTIDARWLDRVKEVVDYAYNENMFVIINIHHDDYIWFNPTNSEYPSDSARLKAIWKQISEKFADYDDRLLFEGMNEPRTIGSANEWMGGTAEERNVIKKYEKDFVDTVRASGGKNADRTLILTSYAASADTAAINDILVPPNSGNVIVSVHYYAPWKFSDGTETTLTDNGKSELANKFSELDTKFVSKGIPVIIDEFGCVKSADDNTRSSYYNYYISEAKKHGIKCFVWDNGLTSGDGAYGIIDRNSLSWNNTILQGIISGAK